MIGFQIIGILLVLVGFVLFIGWIGSSCNLDHDAIGRQAYGSTRCPRCGEEL